jgi:hypothetical protein
LTSGLEDNKLFEQFVPMLKNHDKMDVLKKLSNSGPIYAGMIGMMLRDKTAKEMKNAAMIMLKSYATGQTLVNKSIDNDLIKHIESTLDFDEFHSTFTEVFGKNKKAQNALFSGNGFTRAFRLVATDGDESSEPTPKQISNALVGFLRVSRAACRMLLKIVSEAPKDAIHNGLAHYGPYLEMFLKFPIERSALKNTCALLSGGLGLNLPRC